MNTETLRAPEVLALTNDAEMLTILPLTRVAVATPALLVRLPPEALPPEIEKVPLAVPPPGLAATETDKLNENAVLATEDVTTVLLAEAELPLRESLLENVIVCETPFSTTLLKTRLNEPSGATLLLALMAARVAIARAVCVTCVGVLSVPLMTPALFTAKFTVPTCIGPLPLRINGPLP